MKKTEGKKQVKKLSLNKETVKQLTEKELDVVIGGWIVERASKGC